MQQYHSVMFSWICPVCDNEVTCTHYKSIKILDSFKFLSASLAELVGNLKKNTNKEDVKTKFTHTYNWIHRKFTTPELFDVATKKGVYPYEYIDDLKKLDDKTLPEKSDFFSLLNGHITDDEYEHATNVWKLLKCSTFKKYHKFYLQSDVMLLADVFENFRTMCMVDFNLDPVHYISLPGFSFDAMLQFTGAKVQLLSDKNMFTFFEHSVRGGISQISTRHAVANNPECPNFDIFKDTSYIMYLDANALYSSAMTQLLPYDQFIWMDRKEVAAMEAKLRNCKNLDDLLNTEDGYMLEVDLRYPEHLHTAHNDLPLAPEHIVVPDSMLSHYNASLKRKFKLPNVKTKKLIPHLGCRDYYKVYLPTLILYLNLGMVVTKLHCGVKFRQKAWIQPFVNHLIEKRKAATNDFETSFYKLLSNSVYGKCIEDIRKRVSIQMVGTKEKAAELISSPLYIEHKIYDENLTAIHTRKKVLWLNKPIFVGACVLDIAKGILYDFYYNTMVSSYGNKLKLIMTDTDSLLMHITTDNIYADMIKNFPKKLDLSNYPNNHAIFNIASKYIKNKLLVDNKKKLFCWKDESAGQCIAEVLALKSKMYSIKMANNQCINKGKGIGRASLKTITFEDYHKSLFEDDIKLVTVSNIQSKDHLVKTTTQVRKGLNPFDDKRFVLDDRVNTLAYYHVDISAKRRTTEESPQPKKKRKTNNNKEEKKEPEPELTYALPKHYCSQCPHCLKLAYSNGLLTLKEKTALTPKCQP
jgi:hypothetical protein